MIRRAFIKAGIVVSMITIAIVVFILFGLPKIVSCFYYNPGTKVEASEKTNINSAMKNTNQMSLDMMIYTDVFMPYNPRQSVEVVENGYGSYDVSIGSFFWHDDRHEEVVEREIKRRKHWNHYKKIKIM